MGKKTKLREAQRQHAAEQIAAVLAHSKARAAYPALVATYGDFKPHYHDKLEPYRAFAVRAPEKWRCRIKSRAEDDRFLDLVKFSFARYPVAAHLERAWIDGIDDDFTDRIDPIDNNGGARSDLRSWYIVAGSGGSLYQQVTRRILTRSETHHFLTAPAEITATGRAFWYAVARAAGASLAKGVRIASTRLTRFSVASSFWKDVAHFFAHNEATIDEMDALIQFVHLLRQEDAAFSLKGRSIEGLLRRRETWQRARWEKVFGGIPNWEGRAIPNAVYATGSGTTAITWRFRQIKTSLGLQLEGNAMSHCVATYQARCASAESTIWSLVGERPIGEQVSRLTIEVRYTGTIAQVRGYANRFATAEESAIIKRWANEFGLSWCG